MSRPGNNSSPTGRLRFWQKTYCQLRFVNFNKLKQYTTYIPSIFILIETKITKTVVKGGPYMLPNLNYILPNIQPISNT